MAPQCRDSRSTVGPVAEEPSARTSRARARGRAKALRSSDKKKGYRSKGGRNKFGKCRAKLTKNDGFTSLFITSKFSIFRPKSASFARIWPIVFLSACFGLTPPSITPPFVRFQSKAARSSTASASGRVRAHRLLESALRRKHGDRACIASS